MFEALSQARRSDAEFNEAKPVWASYAETGAAPRYMEYKHLSRVVGKFGQPEGDVLAWLEQTKQKAKEVDSQTDGSGFYESVEAAIKEVNYKRAEINPIVAGYNAASHEAKESFNKAIKENPHALAKAYHDIILPDVLNASIDPAATEEQRHAAKGVYDRAHKEYENLFLASAKSFSKYHEGNRVVAHDEAALNASFNEKLTDTSHLWSGYAERQGAHRTQMDAFTQYATQTPGVEKPEALRKVLEQYRDLSTDKYNAEKQAALKELYTERHRAQVNEMIRYQNGDASARSAVQVLEQNREIVKRLGLSQAEADTLFITREDQLQADLTYVFKHPINAYLDLGVSSEKLQGEARKTFDKGQLSKILDEDGKEKIKLVSTDPIKNKAAEQLFLLGVSFETTPEGAMLLPFDKVKHLIPDAVAQTPAIQVGSDVAKTKQADAYQMVEAGSGYLLTDETADKSLHRMEAMMLVGAPQKPEALKITFGDSKLVIPYTKPIPTGSVAETSNALEPVFAMINAQRYDIQKATAEMDIFNYAAKQPADDKALLKPIWAAAAKPEPEAKGEVAFKQNEGQYHFVFASQKQKDTEFVLHSHYDLGQKSFVVTHVEARGIVVDGKQSAGKHVALAQPVAFKFGDETSMAAVLDAINDNHKALGHPPLEPSKEDQMKAAAKQAAEKSGALPLYRYGQKETGRRRHLCTIAHSGNGSGYQAHYATNSLDVKTIFPKSAIAPRFG